VQGRILDYMRTVCVDFPSRQSWSGAVYVATDASVLTGGKSILK
jgi:hypothetical protein